MASLCNLVRKQGTIAIAISANAGQVITTQSNDEYDSDRPIVRGTTRIIEGKFPDIERVIPQAWHSRAIVKRSAFLASLKAVKFIAEASSHIVRLAFSEDSTGGICTITANAAEKGSATEVLALDSVAFDGTASERGAIGLNIKFLTEAVAHTASDMIAIEAGTPQNPVVIKPVGWADELGIQVSVVMPMTIRG